MTDGIEYKRMYYDTRYGRYCLPSHEDLRSAPPERFIKIIRGIPDTYTESWVTQEPERECISLAYSSEDSAGDARASISNQHDVKLAYLVRKMIPPDEFDGYWNQFIVEDAD